VKFPELWSSTPLATQAVLTHRPGFVWPESCLTKPSSLSRDTRLDIQHQDGPFTKPDGTKTWETFERSEKDQPK
jgi:hypothetical protein